MENNQQFLPSPDLSNKYFKLYNEMIKGKTYSEDKEELELLTDKSLLKGVNIMGEYMN